jgi:multisubunit Na+/H+ antiporter MnhE subunit
MPKLGRLLPNLCQIGLETVVVTAFVSLKLLLHDNMGEINEVDVLPRAKQFVDPNWIPDDWYLNQPPGYRWLFDLTIGRLIHTAGFLTASIAGRLWCYSVLSLGLVLIARSLGLKLPLLLLAIALLLYTPLSQGVIAHEWIFGGLEAKSVAYGFVLLAIWLLLRRRFRWMALLLGLATSFHVLVGGWTFLVAVAWLIVNRDRYLKSIWHLATLGLIYLAASAFAIPAVLQQLLTPAPASLVPPSFIYVFLRLPHHLNPLSWPTGGFIKLLIYLMVLVVSIRILTQQQTEEPSECDQARIRLFEFTLLSLVPFTLGLAIAPFDSQGSLLQFYPFRLGDVMLPLATCLLLSCALQQRAGIRRQLMLSLICTGLLSLACSIQAVTLQKQIGVLSQFPEVDADFKALCDWVRTQTPADATVVSPPVQFVEFSWLAERPTIAKYKLLPQNKTAVLSWYERLSDLSGGPFPQPKQFRSRNRREAIEHTLTQGYRQLTTTKAVALMTNYNAPYLMTEVDHHLHLPIAYQNQRYRLYKKRSP